MKKRLLLITLILASILIINVSANTITGEVITGRASSQQINLTLLVDGEDPFPTIINPINRSDLQFPFNSYNLNNISFDFNITDPTSPITGAWYSLDSGTTNTTLALSVEAKTIVEIGNHTIIVPNSPQTITLYANDSVNNINDTNVQIIVNSSLGWFVCPEKYNGTTTNFTELTIQGKPAMSNISDLTLEIQKYGKIEFTESVNISRDICEYPYNNSLIDDESDIFFTFEPTVNYVYIDPNELPELNKSAKITFYNLSDEKYFNNPGNNIFTEPIIKINGEDCPETTCTIESYINGTFVFNVSYMGALFSIEENATVEQESSTTTIIRSGGGGGGTKTIIKSSEFSVGKTLKVDLRQGETKVEVLKITNTESKEIRVALSTLDLWQLVSFSENVFTLKPGQSKDLLIIFKAREDTNPDLYLGEIIIKSGSSEERVVTIIDVESSKPLLDVKTEILRAFLTVPAGEQLIFTVNLFNLGSAKRVDAVIDYVVKDEKGNTIVTEQETLAIETQTSFVKELNIPPYLEDGRYILYVRATYKDQIATSSSLFKVGDRSPISTFVFFRLGQGSRWALLVAFIISISLAVYLLVRKLNKIKEEENKFGYAQEPI